MTGLERLVAIEQIKRVMYRRVRSVDTKDWDGYAACHAADATSASYEKFPQKHMPAGNVSRGRDEVLATVRKIVDGKIKLTTVHHPGAPEIDIVSDEFASSIWTCEDILMWNKDGVDKVFHGYGHYHETYVKIDGRWLIKDRKVVRLHTECPDDFWSFLES